MSKIIIIPSRGEMIYRYDLLVLRRTGSRDTWLVEVLAPFLLGRGMSSMLSFAKDENVGKCRERGMEELLFDGIIGRLY